MGAAASRSSDDLFAQPRQIVAHELGHITLNTHEEVKAERRAVQLLQPQPIIAQVR
jgi:Zn-dependent peptidase ImmA (M78 family)